MTDNPLKEERGRIIVTAVQQHKIYIYVYEKNPQQIHYISCTANTLRIYVTLTKGRRTSESIVPTDGINIFLLSDFEIH